MHLPDLRAGLDNWACSFLLVLYSRLVRGARALSCFPSCQIQNTDQNGRELSAKQNRTGPHWATNILLCAPKEKCQFLHEIYTSIRINRNYELLVFFSWATSNLVTRPRMCCQFPCFVANLWLVPVLTQNNQTVCHTKVTRNIQLTSHADRQTVHKVHLSSRNSKAFFKWFQYFERLRFELRGNCCSWSRAIL